MFDNLFTTTKTVKKKTNNRFEGIFNTPTATATADRIKISTLPDFLGGGAYNTVIGQPDKLATSTRGYAGVKTQEGKERHHIIPIEFGGSSETDKNINSLDDKAHKRITDAEAKISADYKAGKIPLGNARLQMMAALQKELDAKQGIKQGTAANFFGGLKDALKSVRNVVKKVTKPSPEDIEKAKQSKTGSIITSQGTILSVNKQTGEYAQLDPTGGVGSMKNVAKEGLDAIGKQLLKNIKATNLNQEAASIVKRFAPAERAIMEDFIDIVNGAKKVPVKEKVAVFQQAQNIAENFKLPEATSGNQKLANRFAGLFDDQAKEYKQVLKEIETPTNTKAISDITNEAGTAKLPKVVVNAAESIAPIKHQNEAVKSSFKAWTRELLVGEEQANKQLAKIPKLSDNFDTILKYEQGVKTKYSDVIKKEFDALYKKARANGIFNENIIKPTKVSEKIVPNELSGTKAKIKDYTNDKENFIKSFLNTEEGQSVYADLEKQMIDNEEVANSINKKVIAGIKNSPYYRKEKTIKDAMGSGWLLENPKTGRTLVISSDEATPYLKKGWVKRIEIDSLAQEAGFDIGEDFLNFQLELVGKNHSLTTAEKIAHDKLMKTDISYRELNEQIDNLKNNLKLYGEQKTTGKIIDQEEKNIAGIFKEKTKIAYRENYVPQVYDNTLEEVKTAMAKYMKDKGVSEDVLNEYINGIKELPDVLSNRLKLNPFFSKKRAFPDYKTAIKYGLTPKYTEPSQLLAHYDAELSKTVANRKFLDDLLAKGQVATVNKAGQDWEALTLPFSPKGYYAPPELAKMLNGMFRNEEMLGAIDTGIKGLANISKTMQEVVLSAGVPKTNINFFAMGQLVKNLTAGEYKSAIAFIRSNFNGASIKFLQNNGEYLEKMSNQGIDILKRVDNYGNIYKNLSNTKGVMKKIGLAWDKVFEEKTFKSFMPQMQVQTFKDVYTKALKKMTPEQAEILAGDTVKSFYGLMENVGRGKGTEDALSATFFAPKFREGIIRTLFNTGRSITTDIFNPAFSKNRKLLAGMILTYAGYNALNKQQTGHYMWENPDGKEFDLMVPTKMGNTQDDVIYIGFMPSFLAFARNMFSGGIAMVKGDTDTAKQKIGSLFSMPIKLGSELWANKDYFGREIYKDSDDTKTKAAKMAKYAYLSVNHPFIKEITNQLTTDKPLYQSISEAMEMPLKFSSYTKIEKQEFYDAIYKQRAEEAKIKDKFRPKYTEVRGLLDAGKIDEATDIVNNLSDEDYKLYQSLKRSDKSRADINQEIKIFNDYKAVQELIATGDQEGAKEIVNNMTDDEYKAYKRLKAKLQ